jgi:hypothetical protein
LNTNHLPTSAHDLFGRFLNESYAGKTDWLVFNANEPLTKELASGALVNDVRIWYYFGGDPFGVTTPRYPGGDSYSAIEYHFNKTQFAATMISDIWDSIGKSPLGISLPLEFVLGSFKFQVMRVDEDRLGFRIDNDMTIESGTHIVGRNLGPFRGSVEELIKQYPYLADRPLSEVINNDLNGYPPISILASRSAGETPSGYGGGSLYQTFAWTERYEPCNFGLFSPILIDPPWHDIQIWDNYDSMTHNPGRPFPGSAQ